MDWNNFLDYFGYISTLVIYTLSTVIQRRNSNVNGCVSSSLHVFSNIAEILSGPGDALDFKSLTTLNVSFSSITPRFISNDILAITTSLLIHNSQKQYIS